MFKWHLCQSPYWVLWFRNQLQLYRKFWMRFILHYNTFRMIRCLTIQMLLIKSIGLVLKHKLWWIFTKFYRYQNEGALRNSNCTDDSNLGNMQYFGTSQWGILSLFSHNLETQRNIKREILYDCWHHWRCSRKSLFANPVEFFFLVLGVFQWS